MEREGGLAALRFIHIDVNGRCLTWTEACPSPNVNLPENIETSGGHIHFCCQSTGVRGSSP